jgi:hypothetical protein
MSKHSIARPDKPLFRSQRIALAAPEVRPLMIVGWASRARKRCVLFSRFVQAVKPYVQDSPGWYGDVERLWDAAIPRTIGGGDGGQIGRTEPTP